MNDLSYVQGWYERGKEEEDIIFKFVSYFIAFNFLYRQNNETGPDKESMKNYVTSTVQRFYPGDFVFELISPNSEYYRPSSKLPQNRERSAMIQDRTIEELFCAIYRVRCNLFHGSKAMKSLRDQRLVRDGAKVLEDYLSKWLERNTI